MFFVDARSSAVTWDTIRNFHTGDALTLWGFVPGQSSTWWEDAPSGAPNGLGATMRIDFSGGGRVDASVTFAGMDVAQAKSMAHSTGTQPAGSYLYFAA